MSAESMRPNLEGQPESVVKVCLRVDGGFPLSWRQEDVKDERGRQVRARLVGRRVWGKDIGKACWLAEVSPDRRLVLYWVLDGAREVVQGFAAPEGYDSPWHDDCVRRVRQVAEWHEEQAFNASLDLLAIIRPAVPVPDQREVV